MKNKAPQGLQDGLTVRAGLLYQPNTVREDDSSVEFVLSTETPATIFDWSRCDYVTEILRADGVKLPKNNQVPLLNSHNRAGIENILGSVRDIRVENNQVIGRLYFSQDTEAQSAFTKIKEGHLDSGSVGYSQVNSEWIEKGSSLDYKGTRYEGGQLLTKEWALGEYSLVAIGADPNAKARQKEDVSISRETVNENIKENTEMDKKNIEKPVIEQPTIDTEAIRAEAVRAEQERAGKITELCAKHDLAPMAAELVRTGASVEKAQDMILDAIAKRTVPMTDAVNPSVEVGVEASEKFRAAATDGMMLRSGISVDKPAAGANQFRGLGFADIAREALHVSGVDVSRLSKDAILKRAMSASDFPLILANSANKAMMMGYKAAPSSWRAWAKQGVLNDFKTATRLQLSDAPDMLEVPEGAEIKQGIVSETGESISLATFGRDLVITRQALINDDLGVFNTLFRAFGFRAANLIEGMAYGILTANANMADGEAIFSSAHSNIAGSGSALSATSVAAAEVALMEQTAPQGSKLNIMPRMLLTGSAYKIAASLLVNSTNDTTLTSNANYNPFNDLTAIASAHITGNKWFMIGDPSQIDTVEVAFLNGRDVPTLDRIDNEGDILASKFRGYIDLGAKALEYRGMYYNAGA